VQQQLAGLGCEVAALNCALSTTEHVLDGTSDPLALDHAVTVVAATKVQAGVTARSAFEVGHAIHAAMGYTREHALHRFTQRLLSYRAEFGAERTFAHRLGARAAQSGYDALWEQLLQQVAGVR
jgi:acyl-CoA dehydrogenase